MDGSDKQMQDTTQTQGPLVIPGEIIGTREEYEPGDGTYVHRSDIHSMNAGYVNLDENIRRLSVEPVTNTPPTINKGDIVVGTVTNVRDTMALVQIDAIKGQGERGFVNPGIAAIHVSNIKEAYVKDISKEFAVTDVVKAKVINMENLRLTTSGNSLGVMAANCSNCGVALVKENKGLKCPECGNKENRKLSSDFGTGII